MNKLLLTAINKNFPVKQNLLSHMPFVDPLNLVEAGKRNFYGWTTGAGVTLTITQMVTVAEWGAVNASRIQTTGGTTTTKYSVSLGTIKAGSKATLRMYLKNIGSADITVVFGTASQTIVAGNAAIVNLTTTSDGTTALVITLQTATTGTNVDVYAWRPLVEYGSYVAHPWEKTVANIISTSNQNGQSVTGLGGATAVKVSGQVVAEWGAQDAVKIDTTGGTTIYKARITAGTLAYGMYPNSTICCIRVYVKNVHATNNLYVRNNLGGTVTVLPGQSTIVTLTATWQFSDWGIYLVTDAAGCNVSCLLWHMQAQYDSLSNWDDLTDNQYTRDLATGVNYVLGATAASPTNDPQRTEKGMVFAVTNYIKTIVSRPITTEFTWQVVIQPQTGLNANEFVLMINHTFLYYWSNADTYGIQASIWDGVNRTSLYAGSYPNNEAVIDVAVTYQRGIINIYINGVLKATKTEGGPSLGIAAGCPLFYGKDLNDTTTGDTLVGTYHYGLIYDRALAESEIKRNHEWLRKELVKRGVTLA